jgi:hypothetical protein
MDEIKELFCVAEGCGMIKNTGILTPPTPMRRLVKEYTYNPNAYKEQSYHCKRNLPLAPPSEVLGY